MDKINGWKTYLACAVLFAVAGVKALRPQVPALQVVPLAVLDTIIDWLQGGGGAAILVATLRSAMKKLEA